MRKGGKMTTIDALRSFAYVGENVGLNDEERNKTGEIVVQKMLQQIRELDLALAEKGI